jgi:hypothetical protein
MYLKTFSFILVSVALLAVAERFGVEAFEGFTVVQRPEHIERMAKQRGDQENAKPVLSIIEPADGAVINSSTVKLKLEISGDLMGYMPMMDHSTKMGNHIHVILDNQAYEAYYNLGREFELRNVSDGEHTLRVFPSRPWHESYKNDGAFQMVRFTVKNGGADVSKPMTTSTGVQMSEPAEGKAMQPSVAGNVDPKKPLLTFSRPKGDYRGVDAEAIMIDFWLTNARLIGDGGEYRVYYSINGSQPRVKEFWTPLWIAGLGKGKHSVEIWLGDKDGNSIENGGYNRTKREFTISE